MQSYTTESYNTPHYRNTAHGNTRQTHHRSSQQYNGYQSQTSWSQRATQFGGDSRYSGLYSVASIEDALPSIHAHPNMSVSFSSQLEDAQYPNYNHQQNGSAFIGYAPATPRALPPIAPRTDMPFGRSNPFYIQPVESNEAYIGCSSQNQRRSGTQSPTHSHHSYNCSGSDSDNNAKSVSRMHCPEKDKHSCPLYRRSSPFQGFQRRSDLTRHIKEVHNVDSNRRFKCQHCPKTFKRKEHLAGHENSSSACAAEARLSERRS